MLIMKVQSWLVALLGGAIAVMSPVIVSRAQANSNSGLFGAKDLAADQVVAVAVPIANGEAYNLLILEQLGSSRECWREQMAGEQTRVIDPLLLTFDFTGICGRSTDSNGYSVRLAGEEMAWRYDLRLVREGDNIKLKAFNTDNPWRSPIEVGQTHGIAAGMLKVQLNEGWRFSKRTYEGNTLGHIYVEHDKPANRLLATSRTTSPQSATDPVTTAPKATPQVAAQFESIQIFVPPAAEVSETSGSPNLNANNAMPVAVPPSPAPASNVASLGVLPVPSGRIPSNTAASQQPPPPPLSTSRALALGLKYRVVVDAATQTDQAVVKQLVPDAFNTWVGDRRMLQVGAYANETEAQAMQNRLSQSGFNAQIIPLR